MAWGERERERKKERKLTIEVMHSHQVWIEPSGMRDSK
jgi:hypothetical protein